MSTQSTADPGRSTGARALAEDHLAWLKVRFVVPAGLGRARRTLHSRGTVLIDGSPGSGRNAAARILLHELRGPGGLRELLPEDDEGNPRLDPSHVGQGDRLLLDLSAAEGDLWRSVLGQLPSLHQTARERQAHLAVVVPHRREESLSPELDAQRCAITRPPGIDVLRRALRCERFPVEQLDAPTTELRHFLDGDPPVRDVADLARLILSARRTDPDADWFAEALSTLNRLSQKVASHVVALAGGRQRALLLTSGMLHGARSDAVYEATEALLRTVSYPPDERPLLEREDLSERFREVQAAPGEDGRVRFSTPDYAHAVRTHFWDHMPGLRPQLRQWVGEVLLLSSLSGQDRDSVVAALTEQCLRSDEPEALLAVVRQWAARNDPRLVQGAVEALGHGLEDDRAGRTFRTRAYEWSKDPGISDGLARALVAVCADVMAARHPDQAMVRLHHLARQRRRGSDARSRLLQLVLADRRLHRRMLDRLNRSLPLHRHPVDISLFLEVSAPKPLTDPGGGGVALLAEKVVRAQLTEGWALVFGHVTRAVWSPYAEQWVRAAESDGLHQEALLDVLIQAGRSSGLVLAQLYVLSLRGPLAPLLHQKIDLAQGLQP
ncbi:hypothetical protein [Streptomyces purpureus]|uniref:hypothetical protein n=1 Tax=Streptomyces purpureus TaxID=1951 RepID=UPI001319FF44|nr:hypothetical protein [Streptomyces purpureus]